MAKSVSLRVIDPIGLSANEAEYLISFISKYYSDFTITYNGKSVTMKSLMGLLSLGIPTKALVTITAEGYDENKAIREITQDLVSREFAVVEED